MKGCKIKILYLFLSLAFLFSGCANYNLNQSVWVNTSFVENSGARGNLMRVLYFKTVDSVDYYCLVSADTGMIVSPFKYANGAYAQSGNPRKEANVVMKLTSIKGEPLPFHGKYHKDDAMILMSNDTVVRVFGRLKNKKQ